MRLSLNGTWLLRGLGWERPVQVPGAWEDAGIPKNEPGPFVYVREVTAPAEMEGRRLWLRFEGVSYHCVVTVKGREVGWHTGAWDAFEVEVSEVLEPGVPALIEVEVEKPASLREGPASEPVAGNFPLKETLAGFLPYVWGHHFGGIWQDVSLEARGDVHVEDALVRAAADGSFAAEVVLSAQAQCVLKISGPGGEVAVRCEGVGKVLSFAGTIPEAQAWSPDRPALYEARLSVGGELERCWHFGCRSFEARGQALFLNSQPLYPRMALSWGWYEGALGSNPGRARVRRDLLRLKELGYNGVKLCLWVPPRYYFEEADALGMLLWLELPMWLPKVTPFFRKQTPVEYGRILRQVRRHPSLILYSLGCELNREVGADLLEPLFREAKALVGEALLRDNSGSGEAYGGLLNEYAEYYDYHFYSDLQFFGELIDAFTPRWRPVQPWIFGEFCDLDTFRDLRRLEAAWGELPWWALSDPRLNPQGARWQYDVPFQAARLEANGFAERGPELERISCRQAVLHRKFTLELVRTYSEISGYVITGERDTPISTAGMWNDLEELKFPPDDFRSFNDNVVLAVGWDKRRAWVRGGDRAAYWDTFSYPAGARVRPHVIASNYGGAAGRGEVSWRVTAGEEFVAAGRSEAEIGLGEVRELLIAEFEMPAFDRPRRLTLHASLTLGSETSRNAWNVWAFPADPWREVPPFTLHDPERRLAGLEDLAALHSRDPGSVLLSTAWTEDDQAFVRAGGRAVLLQAGGNREELFPVVGLPFYREAVKVIEPHPAWGDFPHEGWVDMQFFGLATDLALDASGQEVRPILRRLDARTAALHEYAVELSVGRGHVIASTLRFEGGLGRQPGGVQRNTAAAHLLSCWLRYLSD